MAIKDRLKDAGKGAAAGAVAGSFIPGGTIFGGIAGGAAGFVKEDVEKFFETPKFKTPEYTKAETYTSTYDPNSYKGEFSGTGGASKLIDTEKSLGITNPNFDLYRQELANSLRAGIDQGVKTSVAKTVDAGGSRGFTNSGVTRALENSARVQGETAYAQGLADLEQDIMGKTLSENERRTNTALDIGKVDLSNEQYKHGLTQFAANHGLDVARYNNENRLADQSNLYQIELDKYQQNVLAPQQRKDEYIALGVNTAGTLTSAGIQAAPMLMGKPPVK